MIVNRLAPRQSDFEGDPFGWLAFGSSSIARSQLQAHGGTSSLLVTHTSTTAGRADARTRMIDVEPGEELVVEGWVRPNVGAAPFAWRMDWRNLDEVYVSTSEGPDVALTPGAWTLARARFVVPAGIYNGSPRSSLRTAAQGDSYFLDDVAFGREIIIPDSTGPATLQTILGGLAARLRTIAGLRAFDYMPEVIAPPTAIVQLPEGINYDLTFGRGADTYDLRVLLLVAKGTDRAASANLAGYLNAAGPTSVKAAVEADDTLGGLVDVANVKRARGVGSYTVAGVEYLGATFDVEVTA